MMIIVMIIIIKIIIILVIIEHQGQHQKNKLEVSQSVSGELFLVILWCMQMYYVGRHLYSYLHLYFCFSLYFYFLANQSHGSLANVGAHVNLVPVMQPTYLVPQ